MSKYLKKYPWLRMNDPYPEEEESDDFDMLDCLPQGWIEAFGDLMCEDLDRVIKAENLQDFRIVEAKEKYGMMRLFCDPYIPAIHDVVRAYGCISECVCMHCGAIHGVKITNFGWVMPLCRSCCQEINGDNSLDKFDALLNEELPTTIKWTSYSKEGHKTFEMDIIETVEKIKEKYKQRTQKVEEK